MKKRTKDIGWLRVYVYITGFGKGNFYWLFTCELCCMHLGVWGHVLHVIIHVLSNSK